MLFEATAFFCPTYYLINFVILKEEQMNMME